MSIFVVEVQQGDFLFACPSAAESFADSHRQHWQDMCPGIGPVQIRPVPIGPQHRFAPGHADCPMQAGPNQEACRRIRRHVDRWWAERNAWWASA